jgi:hypothetical protein
VGCQYFFTGPPGCFAISVVDCDFQPEKSRPSLERQGVLRMRVATRQIVAGWLTVTATLAVCAAQVLPPSFDSSDATAAKVVSLTGQVSVLRDSYPWALQAGDTVKMQEVILTGPDGFASFEVSDGSTFEVFPNSRVVFRSNPGSLKDLLDLWIGRVKVHIQKLGGQPNPNRIYTPTAIISVRGTTFDVLVEDEDDTTLVSVEEGQVAVRHRLIGESKTKIVNAGEYLRIYRNEPLAQSSFDKGALVQRGLHALADAFYTILLRSSRVPGVPSGSPTGIPGGVPSGGGPPLPGDTPSTPPPPPPVSPPGDVGATPPPPPPGI